MNKLTRTEKAVFIIGAALWLLSPLLLFAQPIKDWDVVREGYYKVQVGADTLGDNFTRYDTALKFAYDYAKTTAQGRQIRILSPSYRFEYAYGTVDEGTLQSLLLKDVNWQHSQPDTSDSYTVTIEAESIADSVRFQYFGNDSVGTVIDQTHVRIPQNGVVRDTLVNTNDVLIQVSIEAYYGTDFYEQNIQIQADLLGEIKKKRMV